MAEGVDAGWESGLSVWRLLGGLRHRDSGQLFHRPQGQPRFGATFPVSHRRVLQCLSEVEVTMLLFF